jgi:hypothetical protein
LVKAPGLTRHGEPEVFTTDQDSQFTGQAFTGVAGLGMWASGWSTPSRLAR